MRAPGKRSRGFPQLSGYPRDVDDLYSEPLLLDALDDWGEPIKGKALDPCCGLGTIVSACLDRGIPAYGSDLRADDTGFGAPRDLFTITDQVDVIVSNVPFGMAGARHMLYLVRRQLFLILPLTFLESRERLAFFAEHPPIWVAPCSAKPSMPPPVLDGPRDRHGAIIQPKTGSGTAPYAWFHWRPGFRGVTTIKWFALPSLQCGFDLRDSGLSALNEPMEAVK